MAGGGPGPHEAIWRARGLGVSDIPGRRRVWLFARPGLIPWLMTPTGAASCGAYRTRPPHPARRS